VIHTPRLLTAPPSRPISTEVEMRAVQPATLGAASLGAVSLGAVSAGAAAAEWRNGSPTTSPTTAPATAPIANRSGICMKTRVAWPSATADIGRWTLRIAAIVAFGTKYHVWPMFLTQNAAQPPNSTANSPPPARPNTVQR